MAVIHTTERRSSAVDWALLSVRVIAGIIFAVHGAQKLFGWFEGPGLQSVVDARGPIMYLVSFGEFFGGLGLIVGILSRFSAFWLTVIMLGAIIQVHGPKGFLLSEGGFEFNLALIGLLLPTLIAGPGAFALQRRFGGVLREA